MRTWQRSKRRLVCGGCCAPIQIGDPFLVLESLEHGWKKARCRACAGEPTPELPPLQTTELRGFVQVGAAVPFDVKQRQAGKDPP
jgi:hypothetical protein